MDYQPTQRDSVIDALQGRAIPLDAGTKKAMAWFPDDYALVRGSARTFPRPRDPDAKALATQIEDALVADEGEYKDLPEVKAFCEEFEARFGHYPSVRTNLLLTRFLLKEPIEDLVRDGADAIQILRERLEGTYAGRIAETETEPTTSDLARQLGRELNNQAERLRNAGNYWEAALAADESVQIAFADPTEKAVIRSARSYTRAALLFEEAFRQLEETLQFDRENQIDRLETAQHDYPILNKVAK